MNDIILNQAGPEASIFLQQLGKRTFYETFAESNNEEIIQNYLEKSFSAEKIEHELSNPESYFFIAYEQDTPVGYLKLNTGKAQTELQGNSALEIERIYVLKDFHGKKVGQVLFEKALEISRQLNKEFIWLGVWEQNTKAVRFYEKNGFVAFDTHIFKMGDEEQTDILMKKTL
ncbi:GNAT family N-acetyltransferase [Flavobacterium psychrotrophum]|uniref:GNAT family N-acetyltransferase n=1 Tax=Flavobacterium psychrotrophum TaxID=2294119 RepID=UPI000E31B178|nr:GNAT family N-acetyltransferase [Flavobacterium psychrotrophum]